MCLGLSRWTLHRFMPKSSILNKIYKMAPSTNDYILKRYESVPSTMKGVQIKHANKNTFSANIAIKLPRINFLHLDH